MKTLDVYLYFNGVNSLFIISYCKYGFEKPILFIQNKNDNNDNNNNNNNDNDV